MGAYDLTNKRFGNLTAKKVAYRDDSGHNFWECHCDCGAVVIVRPSELLNGKKTMCKDCKKKSMQSIKNIKNVTNMDINIDNSTTSNDYVYNNIYELPNGDIFTTPIIFKIVQAINADLTFRRSYDDGKLTMAGELNKFFKIYNELEDLSSIEWYIGEVIYTAPVYNLLTKNNRCDTVTYENLETCLYQLKKDAENHGNFYLAFPKICCGQDRLEWDKVKNLIIKVFANTDFQILLF